MEGSKLYGKYPGINQYATYYFVISLDKNWNVENGYIMLVDYNYDLIYKTENIEEIENLANEFGKVYYNRDCNRPIEFTTFDRFKYEIAMYLSSDWSTIPRIYDSYITCFYGPKHEDERIIACSGPNFRYKNVILVFLNIHAKKDCRELYSDFKQIRGNILSHPDFYDELANVITDHISQDETFNSLVKYLPINIFHTEKT